MRSKNFRQGTYGSPYHDSNRYDSRYDDQDYRRNQRMRDDEEYQNDHNRHSGTYYRNDSDIYESEFGFDQGRVNDQTAHSYNRYPGSGRNDAARYSRGSSHGRGRSDSYNDNDRNFFERADERIRERWNDWTDQEDDRSYRRNSRYDHEPYSGRTFGGQFGGSDGRYRESRRGDDRNFFERAGDRIRQKWNEWTDNDRHYDEDANRGYARHYGYNDDYYSSYDERQPRFRQAGNHGRRESGNSSYQNDRNRYSRHRDDRW